MVFPRGLSLSVFDAADERRFATAARVSEINLALYRTFAQPFVRTVANSAIADWMAQFQAWKSKGGSTLSTLQGLSCLHFFSRLVLAASESI